jgi:hypothetical protein
MGFLGLFGGDPVQKNIARVTNKYAQSDTRFKAMENLAKEGSEDALFGICKRFSFKYDKTIEDEQEKSFAVQTLVAKGATAVPAIRRYMKDAESLSWPLRVLDKIAETGAAQDELLKALDELLAREEPGYTRDPGRKLELLSFLSELAHLPKAEAARRMIPYLADFDQNVRSHAIDSLAQVPDEEVARLPLLAALVRPDEEVRRIKVRAAEVLAEHGWLITEHKDKVVAMLGTDLQGFNVTGDKLVKKGS